MTVEKKLKSELSLLETLQKACDKLRTENVSFAIAGGLAASVYRDEIRATKDVDFAIVCEGDGVQTAVKILTSLGLTPKVSRKADVEGGPLFAVKRRSTAPYIVVGRSDKEIKQIGIDFLLSAIPWVPSAVERAQANLVDFSFGPLPTITLEDVLLAKFLSLSHDSSRFKDMDDVISIVRGELQPDLIYLSGQMRELEITVPTALAQYVPQTLWKISQDVARKKKARRRRVP